MQNFLLKVKFYIKKFTWLRNFLINHPRIIFILFSVLNFFNLKKNVISKDLLDFNKIVSQVENPRIVLFMTTYPFKHPAHGGQIRSRALVDRYQREGFFCLQFCVRDESSYIDENNQGFELVFPTFSLHRFFQGHLVPYISDLTSGFFAENNRFIIKIFRKYITYPVAIIHVEQPWLFKFALKLKKSMVNMHNSTLIYASQNVENLLKEKILRNEHVSDDLIQKIKNDITQLEIYASKHADKVFAVSVQDKEYLQMLSGRNVTLAPNAFDIAKPSFHNIQLWQKKLPEKFFIFIASAHPPNRVGFSLIEDSLKLLDKSFKVVIVGSVVRLFTNTNHQQLLFFDILPEQDLVTILSLAHAVLIPITVGGGSNLKTAEALVSGKYIISTTLGFRGYENYIQTQGVFISDSVEEIKSNMQMVWDLPFATYLRDMKELSWNHRLNDFATEVLK